MKRKRICRVIASTVLALALAIGTLVAGASPAFALPQRANINYPVDGIVSSQGGAHHRVYTSQLYYGQPGDWAMDIHTSGQARPVYARFTTRGHLQLDVVGQGEACRNGGGGRVVTVRVRVDGVEIGKVVYAHLANPRGNGPINNGDQIGTVATGLSPPDGADCWTNPHVHMEPSNFKAYSCFTPATRNGVNVTGHVMGIIGGEFASGVNQGCPDRSWEYPPRRTVSIRSNTSGRYVSAELAYVGNDYAMLRARATEVRSWERFVLDGDCAESCTIQSEVNGRFTSAELHYQDWAYGESRARASVANSWERFRFVGNCDTGCAIQSLANGRYLSAELAYFGATYGMLRARATAIQGWELFQVRSV